jgi:hypothetical protein
MVHQRIVEIGRGRHRTGDPCAGVSAASLRCAPSHRVARRARCPAGTLPGRWRPGVSAPARLLGGGRRVLPCALSGASLRATGAGRARRPPPSTRVAHGGQSRENELPSGALRRRQQPHRLPPRQRRRSPWRRRAIVARRPVGARPRPVLATRARSRCWRRRAERRRRPSRSVALLPAATALSGLPAISARHPTPSLRSPVCQRCNKLSGRCPGMCEAVQTVVPTLS